MDKIAKTTEIAENQTFETSQTLNGIVATIIFQNKTNGYSVISVKSNGKRIVAVGTMIGISVGVEVSLKGKWVTHKNYGEQFQVESFEQHMPTETESIYEYLATGAINGIGEKMARKIVDKFGNKTFDVLENKPVELAKLRGISLKKANEIQAEFRERKGLRELLEFFTANRISQELAFSVYKRYKSKAMDYIHENPYILLEDDELRVSFREADKLAYNLGIELDNSLRLEAGIYFTLTHNLDLGHVFLPQEKLIEVADKLLSSSDEQIGIEMLENALERLSEKEKVHCEHIAGTNAVYRQDLYIAEKNVADILFGMTESKLKEPDDIEKLIDGIECGNNIKYASQQRDAIKLASSEQVMLLTGGPGTGKTTTLRGILALFELYGYNTLLAAPTGRAAQRLSELCGKEASTIHRLLEAGRDVESGKLTFKKDKEHPLKADAVILDEMSMVDIPLMSAFMLALPEKCRLILVGDPDQLPSVGPGQLFDHIIRSDVIPMVRLTEIFRQAQQSDIIMSAHMVNNGEMPLLRNTGKSDFFFLRRLDGQDVVDTITELCKTRLPKNMHIPFEQIQVLSPTRKYITGTANLNATLQAALNPPSPEKSEIKINGGIFRVGDRVIQTQNDYEMMWYSLDEDKGGIGIFNGDIGVITQISRASEVVQVNFDGRIVDYTSEMLTELELAYAMTVHKSQGSEYNTVILAAYSGASVLLNRGLLYTAMTRAKKLLIIVGKDEILYKMVTNNRRTRRFSGLRARLYHKGLGE